MDVDLPRCDPFPVLVSGNSQIWVVTGGRGVGKTTWCQRAVNGYRQGGLTVGGLLSPGRFDGRQKTGFFAVDLASRASHLAASALPGEIDGLRLGPWTFDPGIFTWGNACLAQAATADVLVIDELGPLEFERQTGWLASFDVLRGRQYRLALVVIRPECLEAFSKLGFAFQVKEIVSPKAWEFRSLS